MCYGQTVNKEGTGGRAISAVPMAHAQRFKQQQQQQQPYSAISSPTTASAAAVASVPAAKVSEPEEQAVPLASAPHT